MRQSEKFKQKLLVEGKDDLHVIYALCQKFDLKENFDVIDCNGIDNLFEQIPVRLKTDILTLGVIIDADDDLNTKWNTIKKILKRKNIDIEEELPKKGLLSKSTHNLNIGVWIMPDNNLKGKLEDFIKFLVPKTDQLLSIAKNDLQNIENLSLNKYQHKDRSKALIHTWLAWQKDPGTPIGQSITKKYLDTDIEICSIFINRLNQLFN